MQFRDVVFIGLLATAIASATTVAPSNSVLPTAARLTEPAASDMLLSSPSTAQKPCTGKTLIEPLSSLLQNNITFLPGYRCNVDLHSFALHKNTFFRRQYLAAADIFMEADFFEVRDKLTFSAFADIGFGLGEVKGNLVLTLLNTSTNLALASRYRFQNAIASFTFNHFCFHDIDSKLFPVIYFNTMRFAASSVLFQESDFWKNMQGDNGWIPCKQPSWNVALSYYVKRFFGLVSPTKLNGYNDRVCDLNNFNRFALYKRNTIGIALTAEELIGYAAAGTDHDATSLYWRIHCAMELHFHGNGEGLTLYAGYGIDDIPPVTGLPRFSKDRLLQFGMRIMN